MILRRAATIACLAALATVAGGCGGDEGSAEELCAATRAQGDAMDVFRGFDPTNSERALDQLRSARVTLGELRDAAPAEVRDDLTVEIDYVQALVDGLEGLDGGDATEAVALVQRITDTHPRVEEAAANLAAFTEESCGRSG